jgi:hypothetical protein
MRGDGFPRRQVGVTHREDRRRVVGDTGEVGGGAQRDPQREERMGDTAVAPVGQRQPATADEDVAVVEVAVVDRVGDPVAGQLGRQVGNTRNELAQALDLIIAQSLGRADPNRLVIFQHQCELVR